MNGGQLIYIAKKQKATVGVKSTKEKKRKQRRIENEVLQKMQKL